MGHADPHRETPEPDIRELETRDQETHDRGNQEDAIEEGPSEEGPSEEGPSEEGPSENGRDGLDRELGSDWEEDVPLTKLAPSFAVPATPSPTPSPAPRAGHEPIEVLLPGDRIDDFEIEGVLGRGSFGVVYLAQQLSLNRQVALKISLNRGHEGRTMARLEHENIVQVFSESVVQDGQRRLLCMQYIRGTTLEAIIQRMHGERNRPWSGQSILELIDELHPDPPPFHPAALRERHELGNADSIEAVCWIGARLSEALAYAHQKGVFHRDIKPANILQTRYGRPMLADFNLALQPIDVHAGGSSLFGGTLAYMSPEHLDAFHPTKETSSDVVDARSDIYSLAVVLYELASGDLGLPPVQGSMDNLQQLELITEARQSLPPPTHRSDSVSGRVFDRTVRRCLEPDPRQRYQDAAELAVALDGCKTLSEVEKDLPPAGPVTRSAIRHPFFWLALLAILPHLPIGSTVNIAYNSFRIVEHLSPEQKRAFFDLILIYNGTLYPLCFLVLAYLLRPVYDVWRSLRQVDTTVDQSRVDETRRKTTRWPMWVVLLACLGWLPGGLFFPLALHLRAGPVEPWVFVHFMISCTLSGLIAMTYSYFAIQYLATRVFYPHLWCEVRDLRPTAARELGPVNSYLRFFQILAGLVPLSGAILVVAMGSQSNSTYAAFQFLVITLILLGICGFELANQSGARIRQTVEALTKHPV